MIMESINNMDMKTKKSVFVLGGGITGLSIAWKLNKSGFQVTLLEKANHLGGFARSICENGYAMDIGPHFVSFPKNSDILTEIEQLMGKEKLIEIPEIYQINRAFFKNKVHSEFPKLTDVILRSTKTRMLKIAFELIFNKLKSKDNITNCKEYLELSYGKTLYDLWLYPYLYNRFGLDEPPIELIKSQFPKLTIKKIFRIIKKRRKPQQEIQVNYKNFYFENGMGSLINEMSEDMIKNNARIFTNVEISSINHNSKKITFLDNGQSNEEIFDIIIYSIPLEKTLVWFENSGELKNSDPPNRFHSIMTYLFVDSPNIYDGWTLQIYDPEMPFFRITQQSFLSKNIAPKNKSLLCVEIKCLETDEVWRKNDEEIIKLLKTKLEEMNLVTKEQIEGSKILRIKFLYPNEIMPDDDSNEQRIREFIEKYPDEYGIGIIQGDAGRLANIPQEDETSPGAGGIFNAISTANGIVKKITNSYDIK